MRRLERLSLGVTREIQPVGGGRRDSDLSGVARRGVEDLDMKGAVLVAAGQDRPRLRTSLRSCLAHWPSAGPSCDGDSAWHT
jgi:hypothetical protein